MLGQGVIQILYLPCKLPIKMVLDTCLCMHCDTKGHRGDNQGSKINSKGTQAGEALTLLLMLKIISLIYSCIYIISGKDSILNS